MPPQATKVPSNLINTTSSNVGLNCLRIYKTLFKNVISTNFIISALLFAWAEQLISGFLFGLSNMHWLNEMCKSLVKTLLISKKALCLKIACLPIICPNENLGTPSSTIIWMLSEQNGDNKIFLKPKDTGICWIVALSGNYHLGVSFYFW